MKIIQMLPSISYGDGVSNEALQFDRIFREEGFDTHIYAENIGNGIGEERVSAISGMPEPESGDLLLYHLSIGSPVNEMLYRFTCPIVFVYHNITPYRYFTGYNPFMEKKCREGLWQFRRLSKVPRLVIADSGYNAEHLKSLGYTCPMEVLPIVMDWEDYAKTPDPSILEKCGDGRKNILFVGRIAPNKKQEDLIRIFHEYHRTLEPKSRLILAGSYQDMECYQRELVEYCRLLGLSEEDVVFTGKISFDRLLAYYKSADLFLCMSEHEGFCIPLLEAMFFKVPVMAYDAAAVSETLGERLAQAGSLVKSKCATDCAAQMDQLIRDSKIREALIEKQNERLQTFDQETLKKKLLQILKQYFQI